MSLADTIGRGSAQVDPEISRIAYDRSLTPEQRMDRLESLWEHGTPADRAQISGYLEMLVRLESAAA